MACFVCSPGCTGIISSLTPTYNHPQQQQQHQVTTVRRPFSSSWAWNTTPATATTIHRRRQLSIGSNNNSFFGSQTPPSSLPVTAARRRVRTTTAQAEAAGSDHHRHHQAESSSPLGEDNTSNTRESDALPIRNAINKIDTKADYRPTHLNYSIDTLLEKLRHTSSSTPASASTHNASGTVYLIGTGPGDVGLLTLHALRLMRRATIVLYDRLVSESILNLLNPSATLIYVGKEAGFHTRTQDDIHLLLSFFASTTTSSSSSDSSPCVIRLKGGDPFIFGRGGEEVEFLRRAGGFNIVTIPGVTAASGIAAQLGMPLTMRGFATSVQYLTGHLTSGPSTNCDFGGGLQNLNTLTTYVVYMGLGHFDAVAAYMQAHGLAADTPCVAVQNGTTAQQRVVAAPLADMPHVVKVNAFQSPTLFVVGSVVSLSWCWNEQLRGTVVEGLPFETGFEADDDVISIVDSMR